MLHNFLIVLQQVIVLFILILIGYFFGKRRIFSAETIRGLDFLVLNLALPCTIVRGFQMEHTAEMMRNLLLCIGFAVMPAFRMRFWNIGGEGQFIMGALAATGVAFLLEGKAPQGVILVLMCLAAMVAAGLLGLLVAALKVRFNTNETLLTLMLNYVALYVLVFLGETKADWNFFLDPESLRPVFASFSDIVSFPSIPIFGRFGLNICVILTLLVGVLVFVYLKYTKQGYEIAVVGDSAGTARYAGMKVNAIVLRTVFLSAALIGLAAAFKVGTAGILSTAITDDVGWTGIIVAWLSKFNTFTMAGVSVLIVALEKGAAQMANQYGSIGFSPAAADVMIGIMLLLIVGSEFFIHYKVAFRKKTKEVAAV